MKNPYILRCFVKPDGDRFVGICIDLDIAVVGASIPEVKANMSEAISGYLQNITPENIKDLLPRPSPIHIKCQYYGIAMTCHLRFLKEWCLDRIQIFSEFAPPSNPQLAGACA